MSKTVLISYATNDYLIFQRRLFDNAQSYNLFDDIILYNDSFIKNTNFYTVHKNILDCKRGAGYWLWKPFLILKTLNSLNDGDLLVYLDSQHIIIDDNLINLINNNNIDNGVFITQNMERINSLNKKYTKRDCFVLMECDSEKYWEGDQTEAGQLAFKKSKFSMSLTTEWLNFCCNENIITDLPNICGKSNFEEFQDHRHDQSILTLLSIKYNLKRFPLHMLGRYIGERRF